MSNSDRQSAATVRAHRLIAVFFPDPGQFGEVVEVGPHDVPQPQRQLLDHRSHMTVTMEAFVGGQVSLRVLGEWSERVPGGPGQPGFYAREIELLSSSGEPVQYGIVRVDLAAVSSVPRERILAGSAPLGRVLIEAGTLRDVHDVSLVRIAAGPRLASRIGVEPGCTLYGRVATISLASPSSARSTASVDSAATVHPTQVSRPAVELLEIPLVG